jgi:predicted transcriptional regulator
MGNIENKDSIESTENTNNEETFIYSLKFKDFPKKIQEILVESEKEGLIQINEDEIILNIKNYKNKNNFLKKLEQIQYVDYTSEDREKQRENYTIEQIKDFIYTYFKDYYTRRVLPFKKIFKKFDYYFYNKIEKVDQYEFNDLPKDLKGMLLDLKTNKIFTLQDYGIKLHRLVKENKTGYKDALVVIKSVYKRIEQTLLLRILDALYSGTVELFYYKEVEKHYEVLKLKYKSEIKPKSKPKPSKQEKKLEEKKINNDKTQSSGGSGVSPPHRFQGSEGGSIDFNDLFKWLEEKKWEYGIWISKDDRDHNIKVSGRLDLKDRVEKRAFDKIVAGLNLTFSKNNGNCTIVHSKGKKDDGLYFSWQITKKGYNQFWKKENLSWELFFYNLYDVLSPCDLTDEEFGVLIECLKDNQDDRLFKFMCPDDFDIEALKKNLNADENQQLETANPIGPREIVEEKFNKACLIYHKVLHKGKYYPVMVKIDKSKGPYEIEFIGAYGPTRALQDVTVRAFETVESLSRFEFLLQEFLQKYIRTNEIVSEIHTLEISTNNIVKDTNSQISSITSSFDGLKDDFLKKDIRDDIFQVEVKDNFKNVLNKVDKALQIGNQITKNTSLLNDKTNLTNQGLGQVAVILRESYRDIQEIQHQQKKHILDIQDLEKDIVVGQNTINSNLNHSTKEIKEEMKIGFEQLRDDIQFLSDDLKGVINKRFEESRNEFRNNLYLVLRKLDKVSELTAKDISKELDVSLKSVYNYLKILKDNGLIREKKMKRKGRGRPAKLFKLHLEKLYKLIKRN